MNSIHTVIANDQRKLFIVNKGYMDNQYLHRIRIFNLILKHISALLLYLSVFFLSFR